MKFLVVFSALVAIAAGQQVVTYCYRDQARITQDAGGMGLFDTVKIDNTQHQSNPYDLEPYDVYVSETQASNGVKCGTVNKPGTNQQHTVNCRGTKGRYVHFVAKGEFIVLCTLSVTGRPLPVTTTPAPTTQAPTTQAPTTQAPTPAPTTAPQKLNKNCEEVGQADIIFLIDASGSVKKRGFADEKRFVSAIVGSLKHVRPDGQGLRIAAMTYSYKHKIIFGNHLNQALSNAGVQSVVGRLEWTKGGTYTAQALDKARIEMDRNGRKSVPHIIVTLTDGKSANAGQTIAAAKHLRNKGNHMLVVGIGKNLRTSELDGMAERPLSKFKFVVFDFRILPQIVAKVKKAMFCAPGP